MNDARWERWAPASGILFAIVLVVSFFVAGEPPGMDEGAAAIGQYYTEDRSSILTSTYLTGIGLVLFLWFLGALATALREVGQARLAATAFAGGLVAAALYMSGTVANATLAHSVAGGGDEGVIQAMFNAQWLGVTLTGFPAAVLAAATGLGAWRSGLFPQWFSLASLVGAVYFVASAGSYATDGFFSPDGAAGMIGFFAFLVWTAVAGWLLLQRLTATAPEPAHAAM